MANDTPGGHEAYIHALHDASIDEAISQLQSSRNGLSSDSVTKARQRWGKNLIVEKERKSLLRELLSRFSSPLVLTLVCIAVLSYFFGQRLSAIIVIMMAVLSVVLSFIQEHKAEKNAEKLKALVSVTVHVLRDGAIKQIPLSNLVPGDIIELSAGDMIPADVKIVTAKELFINQSTLNGESFPVEKWPNPQGQKHTALFDLETLAFMGSSVVSGTATALVIFTGKNTQLGKLSEHVVQGEPETAFDVGIKKFTWMVITIIGFLCVFIFVVNALFKHNLVESLLFSLAVAVGLAPEMLPMIVTVNLSKGALVMAKKKVIIKRLDSIQNFGAMDILCTDKTGTLTLDNVSLIKHTDVNGNDDDRVLMNAYINSSQQTGLNNLLDKAIINYRAFDLQQIKKIDEIPFDFIRKIMSVVVDIKGTHRLIAKGAPESLFTKCSHYVIGNKLHPLRTKDLEKFEKLQAKYNAEGFRVLAIAYKDMQKSKVAYAKQDESGLILEGFMAFLDPPKPTAKETVAMLNGLGISLKILSGDNELVNKKICSEVGLAVENIVTGDQVNQMNDDQLKIAVEQTTVFARVLPLQKERVIKALKANGHIVGYLGDGINDSPALKAADTGISVDNAADIAKETADIILLEKNLMVLGDCVMEGRKTFANTLKYIKMGASSNFGNMLSMTGASIFLPFLPMLPTQILLNNFLYDLSQIMIPTDSVDKNYLLKPKPWRIKFIREFIFIIGPVSSLFDFLTYFVMLKVFHASPELFRTGWFVESLFTQTFVIYIIRTNKIPFLQSRPSKPLLISTLSIVAIGCLLPFTPFARFFSFVPLPLLFFIILFGIAVTYLMLAQVVKSFFIKKYGFD